MEKEDVEINQITRDMMIYWMKITSVKVFIFITNQQLINFNKRFMIYILFKNIWDKLFIELDNLTESEYVISFLNYLLDETDKEYNL